MPLFPLLSRAPAALACGLALAGLGAVPAAAQQAPSTPAAPATGAPAAAPGYQITGFRSAKFGMTAAEARKAIAADFGAAAKVEATANPAEGTEALVVKLASLEPGPGPVTLSYIFGATSKRLAHINVVWFLDGEPTPEQRSALVTAAIQLAAYFQNLPTPPKASAGAKPNGPNGLMIYAAVDSKGAGLEVTTDGIAYQTGTDGPAAPPPKGPAALRISYIANVVNPDIVRLKAGSF